MLNIFDILYYILIYFTLFVSIFWFIIFFEKKDKIHENPKTPKNLPEITILIPAYNEEKNLPSAINSVLNQNYPKEKIKIIIIDDASTDKTYEVAKKFANKYKNIKVLRHKENKRKAAALNTGLKHVNSELIGFLDADSVLEKNSLINMIGYFNDSKMAGVIPVIKPKKSLTFSQKLQKVEYTFTALVRKLLTFLDSLYVTPAFALYKTKIIKKVGGWDEENLTEDLEIGLRLKSNGYKIETCMNAEVKTSTPLKFKDMWSQRIRWYRGFIHNSRKYKHIFFNPKFKDLGLLVLPYQYIAIILTIPIILYGFYLTVRDFWTSFFKFYFIGFDLPYFLTHSFNFSGILNLNTSLFIVTVILLILLIKFGSNEIKENIGKIEYLIYIPLYPFINIIIWIFAIFYEITKREYKW